MRLAWALVLLVGCAEGMSVSGPAPDLGPGGTKPDGGPGDDAVVRVCDAAVETLSGRATYVAGSARAAAGWEEQPANSVTTKTCGDVATSTDWSAFMSESLMITAGMVGDVTLDLVSVAAGPDGCVYTLRITKRMPSNVYICMGTFDYVLVVS